MIQVVELQPKQAALMGKQGSWVQQVGKATEKSDPHSSLPLDQNMEASSLTEEVRKAKEDFCTKLQEENDDLKKDLKKKAGEVEALQKEIE